MAHSVIHLTQSRFYSPVFNAAVFDGPIRIYFAQHQEAMALQVYFRLQQYLKDTYANFRKTYKQHGQTVFLMLYPNQEAFENAFAGSAGPGVICERLGDDFVVGVPGPLEDSQFDGVLNAVQAILQVPQPVLAVQEMALP